MRKTEGNRQLLDWNDILKEFYLQNKMHQTIFYRLGNKNYFDGPKMKTEKKPKHESNQVQKFKLNLKKLQ